MLDSVHDYPRVRMDSISDKEALKDHIKQMLQTANEARKRNEMAPKARPHRNRQEKVQNYKLAQIYHRRKNLYNYLETFVTG